MSTVTITLKDNPDNGTVDIRVEFDPPAKPSDTFTPAQGLAMRVFQAIKKPGMGEDGFDVEEVEEG